MSDQKKKTDDITHNPFKALKGLPVSAGPQGVAGERQAVRPDPQQDLVGDDAGLFEKEMGWIGVKRLAGGDGLTNPGEGQSGATAASAPGDQAQACDAELFRQAVADVDQVFKEEPDEAGAGAAAPRRSRLLRLGRLRPEAELDLHGMSREEAVAKARTFLENAHYHGFKIVLIITGKGDRTQDGPVLRQAVTGFLSQDQSRVQEWMEAPRHYGGSGAVVVFLR
jgi:DNA-nicking Smr family endonuclease